MFIDKVNIFVKGGGGGNGCMSFLRQKYRPKGGPDGGDGGRGGSIYLEVDEGMRTLLDFRYKRHYSAGRGVHGQGDDKHGHAGDDVILRVPMGTLVRDDSGLILGDLIRSGQRLKVAAGGIGGRGNAKFATATRKAPAFAEKGQAGEEKTLILELKVLADVGIIGLPNAGKSTLVSRISAAKPEIADYPFTTKTPNLGMVDLGNEGRFVVADVPGLIEGAHAGKGLGHDFLRHVERTAVLVHMVDLAPVDESDPLDNLEVIMNELRLYDASMLDRPMVVCGNKSDLPDAAANDDRLESLCQAKGIPYFSISAVTGKGIEPLLHKLAALVQEHVRDKEVVMEDKERLEVVFENIHHFEVRKEGQIFTVIGDMIERLVEMTDFDNEEAVAHLQHELKKRGVETELMEQGILEGDTVRIAGEEFTYEPF